MEITKKFTNNFSNVIRAKLRGFLRRSMMRYAIGVALVTCGVYWRETSLAPIDVAWKGLFFFLALCAAALSLNILVAMIQSRRIVPRTVTFSDAGLTITHKGETVQRDWDWIVAVEDSPTMIALLVQELPRVELYLPKTKLDLDEYNMLRAWLVSNGKIREKNGEA